MSIKMISAVWDHSKSTGNNRLLMLALADAANDAGYCWPGYDNLQKKMACKSRGSVTNAITHQEQIGELYVDHRQQRGNKYLVLVGLSDEQIKVALSVHFEMQQSEIDETLTIIGDNRNKSKNRTNGKSLKNRPQKVRNLDCISPKNRLDPSLTVNEPSELRADAPLAVSGGETATEAQETTGEVVKPKRKPRAPKKVKTLADLDPIRRVIGICSHKLKPDQGITGSLMIRINMANAELRDRFMADPVFEDELYRAYRYHAQKPGNPDAPKDAVKLGDMVQDYRERGMRCHLTADPVNSLDGEEKQSSINRLLFGEAVAS